MIRIEKSELKKVVFIALILCLISIGYRVGWATIHVILVKRIGIQYLPYTYIAMSIFCIAGSFFYIFCIDHFKKVNVFRIFLWTSFLMVMFSRTLISNNFEGEQEVSWQWILFFSLILVAEGGCGSTLAMQVWTIINDLFLPNQGRRLYPVFVTATLLGSVLGGLTLDYVVDYIGEGNLILFWGFILLLIIPLTNMFTTHFEEGSDFTKKDSFRENIKNLKLGLKYLQQSSLAKVIALVCIFFWLCSSLQDYQFTQIVNTNFKSEVDLSGFYGIYNVFISLTVALFQFLTAEKIVRHIGVFRSLWLLPLIGVIGFSALILSFGFWEGLIFRFFWDFGGMLIQGNAYQLSFNAFPVKLRGKIRGFLEGVINPLGAVIGGGLIILIQMKYKPDSIILQQILSVFGITFALIWFFAVFKGRKFYHQTLIENILHGDHATTITALDSLEKYKTHDILKVLKLIFEDFHSEKYNLKVKLKALDVVQFLDKKNAMDLLFPLMEDKHLLLREKAASLYSLYKA